MIGIYSIANVITKKQYIGSSANLTRRLMNHLSRLEKGNHHNKDLQTEFNRYGIQNFSISIKELCKEPELREREQSYLDTIPWNTLYNIAKKAYGREIDYRATPVYLLDLEGNIIQEYPSVTQLLKHFKSKATSYKVNTKSVFKRKYRIVTRGFYLAEQGVIKTWPTFTNKTKKKRELVNRAKYFLEKDGQYSTYVHRASLSYQIGLSTSYTGRLLEKTDPCTRNGVIFGTIKNQPEYLNLKYGSN